MVRVLKERNFEAQDIEVKLNSYGPGNMFSYVSEIKGDDFQLVFCREQGKLGRDLNDIAGVSKLNIPGKELHVYSDNSGPTLYLYVGTDWKKDKRDFVNGLKVLSKLHGKPRTYLQYSGAWQKTYGGFFYPGKIAPFLAHHNDLQREYDPLGNEPTYFKTAEIFQEFEHFLDNRLRQISKK
jgi:hypothetical protein